MRPVARGAAWVVIALTLVAAFEGFARHPYIDRVGTGQPVTYCYGATAADGPLPPLDRTFTKEACQAILAKDLVKYDNYVHGCIHVALPPHREAALVSFVYNLGPGALCRSAMARKINHGDIAGGCRVMLSYDHARGRVLAGLTRRRRAEYQMCLRDD